MRSQPMTGAFEVAAAMPASSSMPASSMEAVSWHGVEWAHVFVFGLAWEVFYQLSKHYCKMQYADHPKVATLGGSYATAFPNAWVCSLSGVIAVTCLLGDDEAARSLVFPPGETRLASVGVYLAAHSFLGWLLSDLVHLLTHWPTLGGTDMLFHHACFACLSLIGTGYQICPLVIGWLLMGEISSVFLNVRWLLINTGRGESRALKRANFGFAAAFFITRVVVFWAGVVHVLYSELPFLLSPPRSAPTWTIFLLFGFLSAGALLNAFWFVKILQMALRPAPKKPIFTIESPKQLSISPTHDATMSDVGDSLPPV